MKSANYRRCNENCCAKTFSIRRTEQKFNSSQARLIIADGRSFMIFSVSYSCRHPLPPVAWGVNSRSLRTSCARARKQISCDREAAPSIELLRYRRILSIRGINHRRRVLPARSRNVALRPRQKGRERERKKNGRRGEKRAKGEKEGTRIGDFRHVSVSDIVGE